MGFSEGQLPSPSLFKQGGIADPIEKNTHTKTDKKLENPAVSVDYTINKSRRNKRITNRKRKGGTLTKLQDGGNVIKNISTRLPAHTIRERQKPCPSGMYKVDGVCYQMTGDPHNTNPLEGRVSHTGNKGIGSVGLRSLQAGGMTNNNAKQPNVDKINNRRIMKPAARSHDKGTHTHKKVEDIYGNGHTTNGPGHEHIIEGGRILITCPEKGKCHSH